MKKDQPKGQIRTSDVAQQPQQEKDKKPPESPKPAQIAKAAPPTPEGKDTAALISKEAGKLLGPQKEEEIADKIKEMESAFFAVKFYPVAVTEGDKELALRKLEKTYSEGNDTVRQLLLYMTHELLAQSADLRLMHTYDYFKAKNPAGMEPGQLRMNVYRSMFNYQTSLEGLIEIIRLLGRLRGGDDAAKLLTYHYSHLSVQESPASHNLRAAIVESLGKSESRYALNALLDYAKYEDNEQLFQRIVSALTEWGSRLEAMKIPAQEREGLRTRLQEVVSRQMGDQTQHYR